MYISLGRVHPRLKERISETPEIQAIMVNNYMFYEFQQHPTYFGFTGYWQIENYAFVVARSYKKGMGHEMMEHMIHCLRKGKEIDYLIAVIDPANLKSQRMARRLGFTSGAWRAAKEEINNPNIREDLMVLALKL